MRRTRSSCCYENDRTAVVETNVTIGNDYLSAEITMEKEKEELEIIMEGDHVRREIVNTPGEGLCSACLPMKNCVSAT